MIQNILVAAVLCILAIPALGEESHYPDRPSIPEDLEHNSLEHVFDGLELMAPPGEEEGRAQLGSKELVSAFEACVGAKGYQKAYGC